MFDSTRAELVRPTTPLFDEARLAGGRVLGPLRRVDPRRLPV
jgi:hypothetical protein